MDLLEKDKQIAEIKAEMQIRKRREELSQLQKKMIC